MITAPPVTPCAPQAPNAFSEKSRPYWLGEGTICQLCQFYANSVQMQPRNFLTKIFWQDIDIVFIRISLGSKLDLRQHLVCK